MKDGQYVYYRIVTEVPDLTDEEYELLLQTQRQLGEVKKSKSAAYVRSLAVILGIVGVIAAALISCVPGRYSGIDFAWGTFFGMAAGIVVTARLIYCMAEVIENINTIAQNTTTLCSLAQSEKK